MRPLSSTGTVTFLFTDIEGSTRLWEREPERMRSALACHDALTRRAVEDNRGTVVKMVGDGVHAVFDDPLDAVRAAVALELALAEPAATDGVDLRVRAGVHAGVVELRDNDFFGAPVNRAARIMAAAHGGQILVSQAIVDAARDRLPPELSLRDLGTVRLRDLTSPEHIFQIDHPELRHDFPALRSLEATPNNLPQQVTSFIGRENDLAEIRRLLGGTRLLTLLGVGGLGKTRLSLQAAADMLDDYPDGVWFVELAPLTDPRRVPQAVASALGVKEIPGRPLADVLAQHSKDRQLLLILDNCEHLLQACAELARALLQAAPRLRILTSSREPLHLAGETSYHVPPLATPDPRHGAAPAGMAQYAAVSLFVDRAAAVQPSFRLTAQNAPAIADICHRLDGIPLAIELAAARVRALSPEKIAERLGDRFRLLTGGDRTALPRQQTLRALIDWSYDLLSEPERALLRRLAVFAGGWTLEAAEAVGAGDGIAAADVLDVLTHLVDKSLVVVEAEGDRYAMLDTVRQYAGERLAAAGDGDGARARHLAFFVALAEDARPQLTGPDAGAWLARLDLERENVLSAHAWCDRAQEGAELGLRLVSAMRRYWIMRGLLGLGLRITVEALARPGAQGRTHHRCRGFFDAGQIASWMGHYGEAREYLQECIAIARELGDKRTIAGALQPLGLAALGLGDYEAARRHSEEALALARELGPKRDVAAALNALAQTHRASGNLDASEPLYEEALTMARELGDEEVTGIASLNLAMVAIGRGAADRGLAALQEALAVAERTGSKPIGQSVLEVSAGLAALRKAWERAARLYGTAEAQMAETGLHRDPADEAFLAPLVAAARAGLGPAAFAAAEAAGRALPYEDAMAEARTWLAAGG